MARVARLVVAVSLSAVVLAAPHFAGAADDTYVVAEGDTLGRIAAEHEVGLTSLLASNGLTANSVIHPGQQLTIPNGAGGSSGSSTGSGYTVRAGDTLGGIARRHGVSLTSLLAANGITADSVIQPGQRLTIPSTATGSPPAPAGSTYTVASGDTLSGIAYQHGVSLSSLLAANGLGVNSVIHPGTQLSLPAGAVIPSGNGSSAAQGSPADVVVDYAIAQVGKPYRFWSAGPTTFDCSGLTLAAYRQVGVTLVHHSATQANQGTAVDHWSEPIQAGDLIFLATGGSAKINHVGIAVNSTTWVQARESVDDVTVGRIPPDSMIVAVRRIL